MYYLVCSKCSYELYFGEKPVEIAKVFAKYGDRCPRCYRKLSSQPKKIIVRPASSERKK